MGWLKPRLHKSGFFKTTFKKKNEWALDERLESLVSCGQKAESCI